MSTVAGGITWLDQGEADMKTELWPVEFDDFDLDFLYKLLEERTPEQSISHTTMPTRQQHAKFVASEPYAAWYLIGYRCRVFIPINSRGRQFVGCIYITRQREVGLSILRRFQRRGFGRVALRLLRERHPGPLLANVSPQNTASLAFWESLGFKTIQHTLRSDG